MKKIISLLLVTCMLGAIIFSFTGCGLFKKKIDSGTEAAKLLLANERLDPSSVNNSLDLGVETSSRGLADIFKSLDAKDYAEIFWGNEDGDSYPEAGALSRAILEYEGNEEYTWTEFGQSYSSSMTEFTQFIESVEQEAESVAEDIEKMKDRVGVIDKWVKSAFTGERQMLRVYESTDVLLVEDKDGSLHIYFRYTNENAKNVYEMYSLMKYDDGESGNIRTLLIPGERCEYAFRHSDGFDDYFIAENTRGYWTATRFSYQDEYRSASFYPYAIKDGLGFGTYAGVDENAPNSSVSFTVFDPINNRDLFKIVENGSSYSLSLNFTAIESGFVSATGIPNHYDDEENVYMSNTPVNFKTVNGTYYPTSRGEDSIPYFGGFYIDYDYEYKVYRGTLNFGLDTGSISVYEAYKQFEDYLAQLGLTVFWDTEDVEKSIELAEALSTGFVDTLSWNGYTLNTVDNVEAAVGVLDKSYQMAFDTYEEVKDFETVNARQKLSSDAKFADLEIVMPGGNTFDGNTISISTISALCKDTALFESGLEYVLKIGLSLIDENGNPISVNTVPLTGGIDEGSVFSGDGITLSQSGTFSLPKNLDSGEYCVVAYIATKDEGIRVSEMEKVAFVQIYEGEIESSAMHIESSNKDNNLIVKYTIKNVRYIEIEAVKESYTYKEIRRAIMTEALAYGAPYSGAVLEYENGTPVDEGLVLGAGTYRMMCYLQTEDGLAQSYVYLTVK